MKEISYWSYGEYAIQLWTKDPQSFRASHVFREGNAVVDFLANGCVSRAVLGFPEITIPVQLLYLVRANREGCSFTRRVGKHLFTKRRNR